MGEPTAGEIGEAGLALWRYWRSLPAQGCVPLRRDFDPMAVARQLPNISITEHAAPGIWRIRLAGTGIGRHAGRELTGTNFLDMVDPAWRAIEDKRLELVLAHPCGSITLRRGRRGSGLTHRDRTLVLPLRDNEGRARLLVATTEIVSPDDPTVDASLTSLQILERRYLDLGAGVPAMPEA